MAFHIIVFPPPTGSDNPPPMEESVSCLFAPRLLIICDYEIRTILSDVYSLTQWKEERMRNGLIPTNIRNGVWRGGSRYVIMSEGERTDSWTMNSWERPLWEERLIPEWLHFFPRVNGKGGLINKEREDRERVVREEEERNQMDATVWPPMKREELYLLRLYSMVDEA